MIAMFCNTITVLALQDLEQFENGIEEFENDLTEMYKSISR